MGVADFLQASCFRLEHRQTACIVQLDEIALAATFNQMSFVDATATDGRDAFNRERPVSGCGELLR